MLTSRISPAFAGGSGLKLAQRQRIVHLLDISPAFAGGSGLKPRCLWWVPTSSHFSRLRRRERIETCAPSSQLVSTRHFSRLRRRERIETHSPISKRRSVGISPAFAGGSGLKLAVDRR